jgi:hypothetical protein
MNDQQGDQRQYPLRATIAQRKVLAQLMPQFADRLRLDEPVQRAVLFSMAELKSIPPVLIRAQRQRTQDVKWHALRNLRDLTERTIEHFQGIGVIPVRERIYQFRITLKGVHPEVWRRVQVRDSSFDRFHERIQTAMGWTNSHLHHFKIKGRLYGDPWLLEESFAEFAYVDSRATRLSQVLPRTGERFVFEYVYDFGDRWRHHVLFEGCLQARPGERYPLCVEGARACPPEDSGGNGGYQNLLRSIADPEDDEHESYVKWLGRPFDPAAFDAEHATKLMRRGLPDWRKLSQAY